MNSLIKATALTGAFLVSPTYAEKVSSQKRIQTIQQDAVQKTINFTKDGTSAVAVRTTDELNRIFEKNQFHENEPEQHKNTCTLSEMEEAERKFQEKIVTYNGKDYDLSNFHDKVLEPVHEFLPDFDLNMLMKIAMMENSGYGRKPHEKDYEMKHVLRLFSDDNYHKSMKKVSKAGAKHTFQTLPSTEKTLNRVYGIEKLLIEKRHILRDKYGIKSSKDFAVFRNALYGAYQMQFTIDRYLEGRGKTVSQAALAIGYNAGPGNISKVNTEAEEINPKKLPGQTKIYLKKLLAFSKHPEIQIPIEQKYPLGV